MSGGMKKGQRITRAPMDEEKMQYRLKGKGKSQPRWNWAKICKLKLEEGLTWDEVSERTGVSRLMCQKNGHRRMKLYQLSLQGRMVRKNVIKQELDYCADEFHKWTDSLIQKLHEHLRIISSYGVPNPHMMSDKARSRLEGTLKLTKLYQDVIRTHIDIGQKLYRKEDKESSPKIQINIMDLVDEMKTSKPPENPEVIDVSGEP